MKEEYGLFVWPCSVILAEYVWQQRSRFRDSAILELGAGTSLPGLVAASVGANVTLTDDASKPEILGNMRRVCELNKLNCNEKYQKSLQQGEGLKGDKKVKTKDQTAITDVACEDKGVLLKRERSLQEKDTEEGDCARKDKAVFEAEDNPLHKG